MIRSPPAGGSHEGTPRGRFSRAMGQRSAMFTGLVQARGVVKAISPTGTGVRLVIDGGGWTHRPDPGDSIAVNGCCLTLTGAPVDGNGPGSGPILAFDAIPETLAKTTLGALDAGARVNLERSLRADSLIGGHIVQGHVDGVGVVRSVLTDGQWRIRIELPAALAEFLSPKGSVAVEGVSLTIAEIAPPDALAPWFEIALIPETLARTTLGSLAQGSLVNLEMDTLAKTTIHWLKANARDLLGRRVP